MQGQEIKKGLLQFVDDVVNIENLEESSDKLLELIRI